jgi:hypothetical protein
MIFEQHNNILKLKPNNENFIKSFNLDLFNIKYNNHDVILIIDFIIDSSLIDVLNKWMIELERTNNSVLIVSDLSDEYLLKNESIIIVPSIKEAIDYIELERINKDLGL